jgi:HK97 family phage major capsid protein
LFSAIDAAATNDNWRNQFQKAFNQAYFGNEKSKYVSFNKLTTEAKDELQNFAVEHANFTVTAQQTGGGLSALSGIIETDILPTIEILAYNSGILSMVTTHLDTNSKQLPEYGVQSNAALMAETTASTPADRIPRNGDTLNAKNKIQSSTVISELALMAMSPVDYATLVADLLRGVIYAIEDEVFNGTNTGFRFAGLFAGDATFGAIQLDASYVAGTALDNVDYLESLVQRAPANLFDRSKYVMAMNNTTAIKIARTRDLEGRPYLLNIDGNFETFQTGIPFAIFNSIANDRVGLFNMPLYNVIMAQGITFRTDNGLANIRTGDVTVLAQTYADGGIRGGYKDVEAMNAHRWGTLQADYNPA